MNFRKALIVIGGLVALFGASAFANDGETVAGAVSGMKGFSAAIAIAVAAFGGAIAQGRTASAALDGIARNPSAQPSIFTSMIIGLALIESLVIYALVIAFVKC
jgi:F-type H+-transporting ATPase subunit c